jgi:predicted CXXCH cytochrome family protein
MLGFTRKTRWLFGIVLVTATALGGAAAWQHWHRSPGQSPAAAFPLPPLAKTPFLNAGPEGHYVGIETCKSCHAAEHGTYLLTAHSRALSIADPKTEPPDGAFQHRLSGRSYRVYRQEGRLRHEERLPGAEGRPEARIDLPIRYLIGSGNFTRSYLVEVDGFLHESPVTWFTSRQSWDMSPGYNFPQHWSFERPITIGCLSCHAGRVEQSGSEGQNLTILEQAIGCERCHGPGSLHAERHRDGQRRGEKDDFTIVDPGKLSRSALESVCAVCHLNGVATTYLRGRRVTDYRPGTPLSDYRTDYRFDSGSEQMTVVGHVEQLRRSACYQKSEELTCLTCHDPHEANKPKDTVAFYRQKCLNCHSTQACGLEAAQRLKKDPTDNCMACHMPRGATDIPHVAFTHHRIGLHSAPPPTAAERAPELVPIADVSHLSDMDQKRNLGLAYLSAMDTRDFPHAHADIFRARARALLEAVDQAHLPDGATAAGLARIYWQGQNHRAAAKYAERALEADDLRPETRADALLVLANCYIRDRLYERAIAALEKLTRLQCYSGDWRLLGMCYLERGELQKARTALEQALAIRPWRSDVHLGLAKVYERLGDPERAREHSEQAQWLTKNSQK